MTSDPRSNLLRWARRRATERGIPFSITKEDIAIPRFCPILGIPLKHGTGKQADHSPSLDRINPRRGYVPGNVLVISLRANRIKSDARLDELLRLTSFIQQVQE